MLPLAQLVAFAVTLAPLVLVLFVSAASERPRYLRPWLLLADCGNLALLAIQLALLAVGLKVLADAGDRSTTVVGALLALVPLLTIGTTFLVLFFLSRSLRLDQIGLPDDVVHLGREVQELLSARHPGARLEISGDLRGHGPAVELRTDLRGSAKVVLRQGFLRFWQTARRDVPSPALRRAFARFVLLHEAGHYLNRDHRSASLSAALLFGHAPFVVAAALSAVAAALAWLTGSGSARDATSIAAILWIGVVPLAVQWVLVRRFNREREHLADQRAFTSLSDGDRALLLPATEHPPLAALLRAFSITAYQEGGGSIAARLARLLSWSWVMLVPQPNDPIGRRVAELKQTDPLGAPERARFAAALGVQVGVIWLALLAVIATLQGGPTMEGNLPPLTLLLLGVATTGAILAPCAAFLVATDASRMRLTDDRGQAASETVAASLAFAAGLAVATIAAGASLHLLTLLTGGAGPPAGIRILAPIPFEIVAVALAALFAWTVSERGNLVGSSRPTTAAGTWTMAAAVLIACATAMAAGPVLLKPLGLVPDGAGWRGLFLGFFPWLLAAGLLGPSAPSWLRWLVPSGIVEVRPLLVVHRLGWREQVHDGRDRSARNRLLWASGQFSAGAVLMLAVVTGLGRLVETVAGSAPDASFAAGDGWGILLVVALVTGSLILGSRGRPPALLEEAGLETLVGAIRIGRELGEETVERVSGALAGVLASPVTLAAIRPGPRSVARLGAALKAVELAREIGRGDLVEAWRMSLAMGVNEVSDGDGRIAPWPGAAPSLLWTATAARLIAAAGLGVETPLSIRLAAVAQMLDAALSSAAPASAVEDDDRRRGVLAALAVLDPVRDRQRHDEGTWSLLTTGPGGLGVEIDAPSAEIQFRALSLTEAATLIPALPPSFRGAARRNLEGIVRGRSYAVLNRNPEAHLQEVVDAYRATRLLDLGGDGLAEALGDVVRGVLRQMAGHDHGLGAWRARAGLLARSGYRGR